MATLAEIVGLDEQSLIEEFGLEPRIRCNPSQSDNLLHLSPTILLDDKELREGGLQDRGAKDVLSRVAKHICDSGDPSLFQVPEIPPFHMGYAERSSNKASKMAIDDEEAKVWMPYMNLSRLYRDQSQNPDPECEESQDSTSSDEDMDIDPPTAADAPNENDEDVVRPQNSGLKFSLKGSLILLFSILLIFFDKKKKKENSASSDDEKPKIGPNKVSDFLLFWIIPYLLNYTHQKVREIKEHHKNRKRPEFPPVCRKSALDIIEDALLSCGVSGELKATITGKYKDFYGTEKLEYEYELLQSPEGTPIILVPKAYKVTQMPLKLEDIGTKWRELNNTNLLDLFVSKFIRSKKIQRDFFDSLELVKFRQGIDYAIILPNEDTFNELKDALEERSGDYLNKVDISGGGRTLIAPKLGLVTTTEKHLRVCFTYFQGSEGKKVAAMFRAIGAHFLDHFTLIILHGLSLNNSDPNCNIGSLYPVGIARKVTFRGNSVQLEKKKRESGDKNKRKKDFSAGQGKFCRAEFPKTYNLWQTETRSGEVVKNLISRAKAKLGFNPNFERDALYVAYATKSHQKKLKEEPFGASMAPNKEALSKYQIQAVNLDGAFLGNVVKSGRKENIAVVLAIKDVCGRTGCGFANVPQAIQSIIVNFVRAAVVAGLPKVYPSEPDEEDRETIEIGSSEEEDESSDDEPCDNGQNVAGDEQEHANFYANQQPSTSGSGKPQFKQGTPTSYELELLGSDLGRDVWITLGGCLRIKDPKLDEIDELHRSLPRKGYKKLLHWKEKNGSAATYQVLSQALQHELVNKLNLAEKYCYEKQN